jgi:phosphoglycerate kinase
MPKQTIDTTEVAGRRVLMRVDFNVPITDGAIDDDRRIRLAAPSIRSVLERGGRLVLMSHRGRPKGQGFEESLSLRPCAERLGKILGREVGFPSNDCVDDAAAQAVDALADGECLLLENLRFHAGEKKGDEGFAKKLASYADIYCNEAFGTSHRGDASMLGAPRLLEGKPRVAGLLLKKEIDFLSEKLASPAKPYVAVLGGAKVSDKIPAIEHLVPRTDHILIGGAMAYTFLAALGRNVGKSRVEEDRLKEAERIVDLAAREACQLHLPNDHVCSTEFSASAGDKKVCHGDIEDGYLGLDIGPESQTRFAGVISDAKTVVWNGPMGVFEWEAYSIGTRMIAEAIGEATAANGALTVVGGGDSAAAAEKFGVAGRVSHVSTGGGASLEMLSGKSFPTVDLLDDA